jgi:hypothetical protein
MTEESSGPGIAGHGNQILGGVVGLVVIMEIIFVMTAQCGDLGATDGPKHSSFRMELSSLATLVYFLLVFA